MSKSLSDMTLEELWQLFPIILTPHQACWKAWYAQEEQLLRTLLPQAVRISHVGSTAIPDIQAKPIIDILAEFPVHARLPDFVEPLAKGGYICMSRADGRLSFNKGYTVDGFAEKVFHLHLRHIGDHDELFFRDYLLDHPEAARAYEQLKLSLWKPFEHDRDGYTRAKTDFVREHTHKARLLYGDRY